MIREDELMQEQMLPEFSKVTRVPEKLDCTKRSIF